MLDVSFCGDSRRSRNTSTTGLTYTSHGCNDYLELKMSILGVAPMVKKWEHVILGIYLREA